MPSLIQHTYQDTPVFFQADAYLNATKIAKHFKKRTENYLRIESTQNYIKAVARKSVTEENQLVIVRKGGQPNEQGTWLHPKLSIDFARWLDADFAVWCDEQIENIMKDNIQSIPQEKKTLQSKKGCLTLEQQDTIKNIVRSTAEALPKEDRASTTIKMWSAIKTKFGCSYKDVPHDEFNNIISLLARLPIEGELLPPAQPPKKTVTISLDTIAKDERYLVSSNNGTLRMFPLGKESMFLHRDEVVKNIDTLMPDHRLITLELYKQLMALQKQIESINQ